MLFRSGGQDHLSHRLIRIGIDRKIAAMSLWFISAVFVALAIAINFINDSEKIILIAGSALWILLFIFFISRKDS